MIRITRVCFLGKNKFNIPVFPKRAVSLPNQIIVDLSVTAGKVHVRTEGKKRDNLISVSRSFHSPDPNNTIDELKYPFLKQSLSGLGNEKLRDPLNEKLAKGFYDEVSTLTPSEIIKVIGQIVNLGTRPPECLKILCTLLDSYGTTTFNTSECANLLYYFAKLSYKDEALLNSICEHLKTLCHDLNSNTTANILYSLSVLRVRNSELLKLLLQQIIKQPVVLKNSLKVLQALTVLNYNSLDVDEIIKPLSRLKEVDFMHSLDYLSFIWSCIILDKYDCISPDNLKEVLSPHYSMRVITSNAIAPVKWKLLNINAAAKLWSSYNGPVLDGHPSFKALVSTVSRKSSQFVDAVTDTLGHIIPPEYIKSNVNIGTGFILDVEYLKYSSNKSNTDLSNRKVGVVLLNYSDICSDGTITGMSAFKIRILKELQYQLMTLRFNEFAILEPLSSKIQILRSKISKMEEQYENKEKTSTKYS